MDAGALPSLEKNIADIIRQIAMAISQPENIIWN
jgi:hypothetical protein